MAVQPDGKILWGSGAAVGVTTDFIVFRTNPDGSLDTSFGNGGQVCVGFGNYSPVAGAPGLDRILVEPSGNILLLGAVEGPVYKESLTWLMAMACLNPNGSLDTSFGTGGKVTYSPTKNDTNNMGPQGIAIDASGSIVVAGGVGPDSLIVRFTANGALDTSFGKGGSVIGSYAGRLRLGRSATPAGDIRSQRDQCRGFAEWVRGHRTAQRLGSGPGGYPPGVPEHGW